MATLSPSQYVSPGVQAFIDGNVVPNLATSGQGGVVAAYVLSQIGWTPGDPIRTDEMALLFGLIASNPTRTETDPVALAGDLTPETITIATVVPLPGIHRLEIEGTYTSAGTIDGYQLPPITGTDITEVGPSTSLHVTGLGTSTLRVGYVATIEVGESPDGLVTIAAAVSTVAPADGASFVCTAIRSTLAEAVLP